MRTVIGFAQRIKINRIWSYVGAVLLHETPVVTACNNIRLALAIRPGIIPNNEFIVIYRRTDYRINERIPCWFNDNSVIVGICWFYKWSDPNNSWVDIDYTRADFNHWGRVLVALLTLHCDIVDAGWWELNWDKLHKAGRITSGTTHPKREYPIIRLSHLYCPVDWTYCKCWRCRLHWNYCWIEIAIVDSLACIGWIIDCIGSYCCLKGAQLVWRIIDESIYPSISTGRTWRNNIQYCGSDSEKDSSTSPHKDDISCSCHVGIIWKGWISISSVAKIKVKFQNVPIIFYESSTVASSEFKVDAKGLASSWAQEEITIITCWSDWCG